MALLLANGLPVVRASIERPLVGPWTVDFDVDGEALSGAVEIVGGGLTLKGTVVRSGSPSLRSSAQVVAGGGQLGAVVGPRFWRRATAKTLLADLFAGRETLDVVGSDAGLLGRELALWVRVEGSVSAGLAAVARALETSWRTTALGAIRVGSPTWASVDPEHVVVLDSAREGRLELALEDLTLDAGVALGGRRLRHITYEVSAEAIRATAWT